MIKDGYVLNKVHSYFFILNQTNFGQVNLILIKIQNVMKKLNRKEVKN